MRISSVVIKLLKSLVVVVAAYTGDKSSRVPKQECHFNNEAEAEESRGLICLETPPWYVLAAYIYISTWMLAARVCALAFVHASRLRVLERTQPDRARVYVSRRVHSTPRPFCSIPAILTSAFH